MGRSGKRGAGDDTILKFIEGVDLVDGEVAVRFKARVTVEVELPERRLH